MYRLELSQDDGYAADNQSFAFGLGHGSSRVLLLTSGNLFLEKALQLSGAEVTRVALDESKDKTAEDNGSADKEAGKGSTAADVPPVPEGEFDLLVIDGDVPEGFKQGKWAELAAKTPLWTIGGEGAKVGNQGARRAFQASSDRLCNLVRRLFWHATGTGPCLGRARYKAGDQPIVYAGSENGRPRLSFNFLLQDSDLPLSPEFPVMVSNALEWMTSGKGSGLGRYMAGAQADIPIAADTVAAKWVPASGLALTGGIPAAEAPGMSKGYRRYSLCRNIRAVRF